VQSWMPHDRPVPGTRRAAPRGQLADSYPEKASPGLTQARNAACECILAAHHHPWPRVPKRLDKLMAADEPWEVVGGRVVEDRERGANGVAGGYPTSPDPPALRVARQIGLMHERDIWVRPGKDDVS
jgi:hypothetical protein